jgi:hypothetical protein
LERLLLNDPLDQPLHFAILAVLGEFPLLCHAHSLPQTQQSDQLRGPVCTVANTKRVPSFFQRRVGPFERCGLVHSPMLGTRQKASR